MSIIGTKEWQQLMETIPNEYQESYSRLTRATEVLTSEPDPEVGLTPKEVIWTKKQSEVIPVCIRSAEKVQSSSLIGLCTY
jgi:polyhydroxyalkanoate synthase